MTSALKPGALARETMWNRVGTDVDMLIIGGGINGAGIARDAASRGMNVLLCEKNDLAYGTSSRSSKLVHGGLRYLEQGEIGLVFESVSERAVLMKLAPHLVTGLGFLVPIYKGKKPSLPLITVGIFVYEALSLFTSPKPHRTLSVSEAERAAPGLRTEKLNGAPLYYDCATDDVRLTLETAIDAAEKGATIATWTEVESFVHGPGGLVRGAVVKNVLTGETRTVNAGVVVNATGPWTDRTLAMGDKGPRWIRPTKGVHLVVPRERLPVEHCVACFHPDDGRYLFVIPWGDHTYVGTTDTDYTGTIEDVCATRSDIDYLLRAVTHYFPGREVTPGDVTSTWAGLRPLIAADGVSESKVSREEKIAVNPEGVVTVAGGKLTTYRAMAALVVDKAVEALTLRNYASPKLTASDTKNEPLPGGRSFPSGGHDALTKQLTEEGEGLIGAATAALLASSYGTRAFEVLALVKAEPELGEELTQGRPEILAQVRYGVQQELAATVADIAMRRTQLYYRDVNQGLDAVPHIAEEMQRLLGWSDEEKAREVARYEAEVALSRRWKSE